MRRADRLFAIVQALRGRRLTTAKQLADRLQVSERTIYRDIQDLSLSGVPILGEAGVGYVLKKGFDIPPLMFDYDEVEALLIGARLVGAWGSTELSKSAERAMEKIAAVLPESRRMAIDATQIYAPNFHVDHQTGARFELFRHAIRSRHLTTIKYETEEKKFSERRIRPLALHFWGERWTVAAWCEMRNDFRSFRLDRMREINVSENVFVNEAGKTLADYLRKVNSEGDKFYISGKAQSPFNRNAIS
jgi:predicted DNA-binding transcriptional regulator YafY